ncbi:cysteine proteinase [Panus rudis PR-1116 ss-1]|nr:cysteine proteinase [Panus rudis PR-1116 ss-1]
MANQHPHYSHPGPSSYYPHTPPPHPYGYPPHPNAVHYYQYPIPPPMNGQPPMHSPTSPRGRGGYPAHRGGPSYQHYQPIPPQHYIHPPPISASPVSPASPYTHPQKYPPHPQQVPYSPSYHTPPNVPYPPQAWPGQPLSPLPKQLSMLPPPQPNAPEFHPGQPPQFTSPPQPHPQDNISSSNSPPYDPNVNPPIVLNDSHDQSSSGPPPPIIREELVQEQLAVDQPHQPHDDQPPQIDPAEDHSQEEEPPSHEQPESSSSPPEPAPQPQFSSSDELASPSQPAAPEISISGWVIWSHRGNPSDAPGIIISPRAHPPDHILQNALKLPSPPASPKVKPKVATIDATKAPVRKEGDVMIPQKEESPELEAPSSSATETTPACSTAPDTPVPGSPVSSNTSVSVAVASPALGKTQPLTAEPKTEPAASEPTPAPANVEQPSATTPTPQLAPSTSASASTSATPAPPTPQPPAPKKSWASLLQTDASSSKSRLPVSSVVGFSIPATSTFGTVTPNGTQPSSSVSARPELLSLLTTGPTGSMPVPKLRPRGIINTGNMCFANSVLQVLVYCPPFYRLFIELGKFISGPVVGSQREGTKATPLVEAIIQFLKEFNPKGPKDDDPVVGKNGSTKGKEREEDDFYDLDSFIPNYVYEVMKEKKRFANMIGGYQEDAEEFLGFFLDTLEEELATLQSTLQPSKPAPATDTPIVESGTADEGWLEVGKKNRTVITRTIKSVDSPITRIFGGKFRSTLRAPHQKDSVTIEDWRALRLDISRDQVHTVQDALQLLSQPQPVQLTSPTRPGQVIEASQQTLIESLPPILVLHMKRFMYDTKVGDVVKIGKQVAYGPDLEIRSELLAPAAKRTPHPVKYQLFGVLYHHGQSASGGHYTLDVLHPNRDMNDRPRAAWIRIDDELVSDIRAEDVFGGQERDDRCAYLLFYRRLGNVNPARTWSSLAAAGAA